MTEDAAPPLSEDARHWDELQHLFHLVEGTAASERESVLAAACTDAALCARVLALVQAADALQPATPPTKLAEPTLIGPYRDRKSVV